MCRAQAKAERIAADLGSHSLLGEGSWLPCKSARISASRPAIGGKAESIRVPPVAGWVRTALL
jgi:hypothetical protein